MTVQEKLQRLVSNPILYIEKFMRVVDKRGRLVKFS